MEVKNEDLTKKIKPVKALRDFIEVRLSNSRVRKKEEGKTRIKKKMASIKILINNILKVKKQLDSI